MPDLLARAADIECWMVVISSVMGWEEEENPPEGTDFSSRDHESMYQSQEAAKKAALQYVIPYNRCYEDNYGDRNACRKTEDGKI